MKLKKKWTTIVITLLVGAFALTGCQPANSRNRQLPTPLYRRNRQSKSCPWRTTSARESPSRTN